MDGVVKFDDAFQLILEGSAPVAKADDRTCPKCGKGEVVKGNTAFGCTAHKAGCDFRISFAEIKEKAAGRAMSKELVWGIIGGAE